MSAVDTGHRDTRQVGLSSTEAAALLLEHGRNEAPHPRPRSALERVTAQLRDPMILLLCAAFAVVTALGDLTDAVVIAVVVTLNTTLGVVQELRAEQAIAALEHMSAPTAAVIRDGVLRQVDAAELVPTDVVRLEAGDVVAADAELVEVAALEVDESAMTGESMPTPRLLGEEVLAGTVVTRGRGMARVVRTGADSGLGRIAQLIATTELRPTPLQLRLAALSRLLVAVTLALAAVVLVLGLARGEPVTEMLVLAVSLAVAAIPESLPAVVSVALALGAYRMARRSAVVRWLPAVETLGSVNVLATDKTGTLTEGSMVVERLWTPNRTHHVGDATSSSDRVKDPLLDPLLRILVLCNDADLGATDDGHGHPVGDPMEVALLVAAARGGMVPAHERTSWRRVDEIPFDSERRVMLTLHEGTKDSGGRRLISCKGAPEALLPLVRPTLAAAQADRAATELARHGFRVIAAAQGASTHTVLRPEDQLELVGLIAITDPVRPQAESVVRACHDAGIRTVLITGDHPATAKSIALRLGISEHAEEGTDVADGVMVARGDHVGTVESISVYARTKPEQKVAIVRAWQDRGAVVAMTGDGVNDAPALRRADIGVAMGQRGTEVARQAADLVLADDDLGSLVAAVGEGRRIYANIRTFLHYALSGGLAEITVIVLAPLLGMPLPLLPAQILWINMLTHGVPGVAFGGEPLDERVMAQPSRPPRESVLGGGLWRHIALTGALIAAVSTVAALLAQNAGAPLQSWVFVTLGLAQLGVGWALRAPRRGAGWRARGLEAAIIVAVVLQLLAVTWTPLCHLLSTEPVTWTALGGLALLSALPGVAVAVVRRGRGVRIDS